MATEKLQSMINVLEISGYGMGRLDSKSVSTGFVERVRSEHRTDGGDGVSQVADLKCSSFSCSLSHINEPSPPKSVEGIAQGSERLFLVTWGLFLPC